MCGWDELCACAAVADCCCVAQGQVTLTVSIRWTSSMRGVGLGALLLSATLDMGLQPHRCQFTGSQYSAAAEARSMYLYQ